MNHELYNKTIKENMVHYREVLTWINPFIIGVGAIKVRQTIDHPCDIQSKSVTEQSRCEIRDA